MKNEEYKKLIIEMIEKIDNAKSLERIFNYVHKIFVRKTSG